MRVIILGTTQMYTTAADLYQLVVGPYSMMLLKSNTVNRLLRYNRE